MQSEIGHIRDISGTQKGLIFLSVSSVTVMLPTSGEDSIRNPCIRVLSTHSSVE